MTDHHDNPPPAAADWVDGLLRTSAREAQADYVDDASFTARVMAALPAPIALPAWRKPALTALWAAAGIGIVTVLPSAVSDVAYELLRIVAGHRFTFNEAAVTLLAMGAASWAGTLYALRRP